MSIKTLIKCYKLVFINRLLKKRWFLLLLPIDFAYFPTIPIAAAQFINPM